MNSVKAACTLPSHKLTYLPTQPRLHVGCCLCEPPPNLGVVLQWCGGHKVHLLSAQLTTAHITWNAHAPTTRQRTLPRLAGRTMEERPPPPLDIASASPYTARSADSTHKVVKHTTPPHSHPHVYTHVHPVRRRPYRSPHVAVCDPRLHLSALEGMPQPSQPNRACVCV